MKTTENDAGNRWTCLTCSSVQLTCLVTLDHRCSIAFVAVPSESTNFRKTPQLSRKAWLALSIANSVGMEWGLSIKVFHWNGIGFEHDILLVGMEYLYSMKFCHWNITGFEYEILSLGWNGD